VDLQVAKRNNGAFEFVVASIRVYDLDRAGALEDLFQFGVLKISASHRIVNFNLITNRVLWDILLFLLAYLVISIWLLCIFFYNAAHTP